MHRRRLIADQDFLRGKMPKASAFTSARFRCDFNALHAEAVYFHNILLARFRVMNNVRLKRKLCVCGKSIKRNVV